MHVGRKSLEAGRARARAGARAVVALAACAVLAACGPERLEKTEADLAAAIAAAEARGDTATLRVFVEVPFAFDRLYIAAPGTSPDTLAAALGPEWRPEMAREIDRVDHFHLLVFDVQGKLYPAALPRRVAEVAPELTGRMYVPESAVFRVRRPPGAAAPTLSPY